MTNPNLTENEFTADLGLDLHGALYLAVSCAVLTMLLSVYFIFLNRRLFPFLHARTVD
jgi:hypothetical protein